VQTGTFRSRATLPYRGQTVGTAGIMEVMTTAQPQVASIQQMSQQTQTAPWVGGYSLKSVPKPAGWPN